MVQSNVSAADIERYFIGGYFASLEGILRYLCEGIFIKLEALTPLICWIFLKTMNSFAGIFWGF